MPPISSRIALTLLCAVLFCRPTDGQCPDSTLVFAHDFESIVGTTVDALCGPPATLSGGLLAETNDPWICSGQHVRTPATGEPRIDTNTRLTFTTEELSFSIHYNSRFGTSPTDTKRFLSTFAGAGPVDPDEFVFDTPNSTRQLRIVTNGVTVLSDAFLPEDGAWHQVGFIFDRGSVCFYLDGAPFGQPQYMDGVTEIAPQGVNWHLIEDPTSAGLPSEYFPGGDYDEARLWTRVVSELEMTESWYPDCDDDQSYDVFIYPPGDRVRGNDLRFQEHLTYVDPGIHTPGLPFAFMNYSDTDSFTVRLRVTTEYFGPLQTPDVVYYYFPSAPPWLQGTFPVGVKPAKLATADSAEVTVVGTVSRGTTTEALVPASTKVTKDSTQVPPCLEVSFIKPHRDSVHVASGPWIFKATADHARAAYPLKKADFFYAPVPPEGQAPVWTLLGTDIDLREPRGGSRADPPGADGIRIMTEPPPGLAVGHYLLRVTVTDCAGCASSDTTTIHWDPYEPIIHPKPKPDPAPDREDPPETVPPPKTATPGEAIDIRIEFQKRQGITVIERALLGAHMQDGFTKPFHLPDLSQLTVIPGIDSTSGKRYAEMLCGPTSLASIIKSMAACDPKILQDASGNDLSDSALVHQLMILAETSPANEDGSGGGTAPSKLWKAFEKWTAARKLDCKYSVATGKKGTFHSTSGGFFRWDDLFNAGAGQCAYLLLKVYDPTFSRPPFKDVHHWIAVSEIGFPGDSLTTIRIMEPMQGQTIDATFDLETSTLSFDFRGTTLNTRVLSMIPIVQKCKPKCPPGGPSGGSPDFEPFLSVDQGFRPRNFELIDVDPDDLLPYPFTLREEIVAPTDSVITLSTTIPSDAGEGIYWLSVGVVDDVGSVGLNIYRVCIMPTATGLEPSTPRGLTLAQNQPNPFRPSTSIRFTLEERSPATLTIFDVSGRRVRSFEFGDLPEGAHDVVWDRTDEGGRRVGAGVYFYRLAAGGQERTRRMVVLN